MTMPRQHQRPTQCNDNSSPSEDEPGTMHTSMTPSRDTDSEIEIDMNMSWEELYKNARKAQSKANVAIAEVKATRRKATETAESPAKRPKITTSDVQENIKIIEHYGRKFLVTHLLWLHGNIKTTFETDIDDGYQDAERFENTETMIQGQLRDICDVLPQKYHNDLSRSWLRRAVRTPPCATMGILIRTRCGPTIFNCTEADMKSADYRREHFGTQIGWTTNDSGECAVAQPWQGEQDINTIFLNPKLMMVVSAIIRGPASVVSMSEGRGSASSRNNETLDVKWGLDHTTPGMIAAGAILARWAASVDALLTDRGAQTGIRWRDDFEDYLKYLFNGLRLRKASVLKIFREWDKVLFPSSSTGFGGRQARNDRDSRMKTMMDSLEDDIEVEGTDVHNIPYDTGQRTMGP
ncbi:uncharacterized protein F5891DRAFT_1258301 [Suillus fuscotomentosus]|uniref:Uncharacterized protein n=1 Tax=Suillus fuscotomentosus TaxID=1912939 RepID=A0AAD4HEN7_9AGAM|nr:uncharacterized protein F5891DRAFT_1258301 [Suillus fuscotomentosus]KAG1893742.1 hypothetical protein F5891DRAFT_1258301 [Suillus fuscotomentosus]